MTYELMVEKALDGIEFGNGKAGRQRIYPFADIAIGGGFRWPDDKGENARGNSIRQNLISSSVVCYTRSHAPETKFVTSVIVGFVYVKRIA